MARVVLSAPGRLAGLAPVFLRLITGVIMGAHGYQKLITGPEIIGRTALDPLGVPFPILAGYLLTFAELVGGLLLIAGFLSRVAAAGLIIELFLAIFLVKLDVGLIGETAVGAELDLALIAGLTAVFLLGPGRPSVDHAIGLEDSRVVAVSERAAEGAR